MNYADEAAALRDTPSTPDASAPTESFADQATRYRSEEAAPAAAPIRTMEPPTWFERQLAKLPDSFAADPLAVSRLVGTTLGSSGPGRAVMGAMDMGTGGVQLAAHATPGDASATDQKIAATEAAYEAARQANAPKNLSGLVTGQQPDAGTDWWRIGGNVATGVAAPGGKIIEGANFVNRLIQSGRVGLTMGLTQPVADAANYWSEKAKQGGGGIIGAFVGQPVAELGAKVVGTVANKAMDWIRSFMPQAQDATVAQLRNASPELQAAIAQARAQGRTIDPKALARQVEADSLPVKMRLMPGQASQDPVQISNEMNMRGANNGRLAYEYQDQNQKLIDNLAAIRKNVAPDVTAPDHVIAGQNLMDSIQKADNAKQAQISALYGKLKDANGGKFPVDGVSFVDNADAALSAEMKAPFVPSSVRSIMDSFIDGKKPMTYENFENLRTILAAEGRKADRAGDGNTSAAINTVRNALEQLPMSGEAANVKPIADAARSAARDRFQQIDETPALKAVVNGTAVADNFIQKHVVGGTKQGVANLAMTLKDDPTALQTIKAGVINYLQKSAVGQGGNFSQAGYNSALDNVRPKLGLIFNPDEAGMLDTVGNVARYTQAQPRGSFVDNSNTDVSAFARSAAAHAVDSFTRFPIGTIANNVATSALEGRANTTRLGDILNVGTAVSSPGPVQQFLTRDFPRLAGQGGAVPLSSFLAQQASNRNEKKARNGQ